MTSLKDYIDSIQSKSEIMNHIDMNSICNMVGYIPNKLIETSLGKFIKMGEQGENSIVYQVKDKGISIKIMKHSDKNKRENDFYFYFSNNYINFPVVYRDIDCMACPLEEKGENISCLVVLSELYDGSLASIKSKLSKEQIISMVAQIISACSVLEQLELVHGDLHSGNVLYKNIDKDDFIQTQIQDKIYNIKTFGKLWVLWDFGNMTYTGELTPETSIRAIDTIRTDIHKFIPLVNKQYLNDLIYDLKDAPSTKVLIDYLCEKYPDIIKS
jgi:serine/threonine protein kinase